MSLISKPSNILLIQLGDIGDVILTAPTIRATKETYPNARISILLSKPYGSLLNADPHVFEVIELERKKENVFKRIYNAIVFAWRLRKRHYDLVIDLRTGDRGAILAFITGATIRVGRPGKKNQFWHALAFNTIIKHTTAEPLPTHPGADQSLRLVRELGITAADSIPHLFISERDKVRAEQLLHQLGIPNNGNMVTINPYSRWKYKEWSNDKWGEVIDRIWAEQQIPSVLIGSAEEFTAGQKIVQGRENYTYNLAGKTTLGELAALLSNSSLHLGVDSAAPHIASAVDTPTITLHGPTDWRAWRLNNEHHRIVTMRTPCQPCNMMGGNDSGKSKCLDELDALEIISLFLRAYIINKNNK
jgi:predicted lipopolysaccharide heptosyltransferase III